MRLSRIFTIALLASLTLTCALSIDIPVTVIVLNSPPEILSLSVPSSVRPGQAFSIELTVRDNNTLDDLRYLYALGEGQNSTSTLLSSDRNWVATYSFTFVAPLEPTSASFDGSVHVGDEELVLHEAFSIPYGPLMNISPVTESVNVVLAPGSSTTRTIRIRVWSSVPADLYARSVGDLHTSLNGISLTDSPSLVMTLPPTDAVFELNLTVSVPSPWPGDTSTELLQLGLMRHGEPFDLSSLTASIILHRLRPLTGTEWLLVALILIGIAVVMWHLTR